jgi:SAM-dependent methyltransferase
LATINTRLGLHPPQVTVPIPQFDSAGSALKDDVRTFWDAASCGEVYAGGTDDLAEQYRRQTAIRYELEPYILDFADFASARDKDVLEIGVGMGADHQRFAEAGPRSLTGIDLTPRAIEHTSTRFGILGLNSTLQVADAERLPFADASFDIVYSWGVIHHSPDTPTIVREIHRVLRPGGRVRVMVYHTWSFVGLMLWTRYALLRGQPFSSLAWVYHHFLESPGTKAYTRAEGRALFSKFSTIDARALLSFGDLLLGEAGQRHRGPLLTIARALWPRRLIRAVLGKGQFGLYLLINATK